MSYPGFLGGWDFCTLLGPCIIILQCIINSWSKSSKLHVIDLGSFFFSAYHVPNWDVVTKAVKTHMAANCACRSPGTLPAIFIAESMMDHVARSLQLDVEAVKRANFYQKDQVSSLKIY